jgi:hypothetical protein
MRDAGPAGIWGSVHDGWVVGTGTHFVSERCDCYMILWTGPETRVVDGPMGDQERVTRTPCQQSGLLFLPPKNEPLLEKKPWWKLYWWMGNCETNLLRLTNTSLKIIYCTIIRFVSRF